MNYELEKKWEKSGHICFLDRDAVMLVEQQEVIRPLQLTRCFDMAQESVGSLTTAWVTLLCATSPYNANRHVVEFSFASLCGIQTQRRCASP
jgi:hypothetical protein